MGNYQFIYNQAGEYIDLRCPDDIGKPVEGSIIITLENPTADQLKHPDHYKPNEDQTNLIPRHTESEKRGILFSQAKTQLTFLLKQHQNQAAITHDYLGIDQAIQLDQQFKNWAIDCREKSIAIKTDVLSGKIDLPDEKTFINAMPKIEDYLNE